MRGSRRGSATSPDQHGAVLLPSLPRLLRLRWGEPRHFAGQIASISWRLRRAPAGCTRTRKAPAKGRGRKPMRVSLCMAASLALLAVGTARAEFPDRPVRMLYGFAPGG